MEIAGKKHQASDIIDWPTAAVDTKLLIELFKFFRIFTLLLFLTLGGIWIADTAAYFAGRRFGKHKLAPRISPGKTAEGLAGAYIAVSAYAVIALRIYQPDAGWPAYMALLVFGFILTSLSVTGDLFESWVKRRAGAKDSGDLLPGHGGILDRIDSVTATIPFAVLFFAGMLV